MNVDGIDVAQSQDQLDLFDELIERFRLHTIIELGLYRGGLANFLMKKPIHYYGVEFVQSDLDLKVLNRPEIIIGDATNPEIIKKIQEIINSADGSVLVFCDTFDKPREMSAYSKLIRIGDIIQGHDYPGEVSDKFLAMFGDEHPDLEELEPERIRKTIGTTVWMKVR